MKRLTPINRNLQSGTRYNCVAEGVVMFDQSSELVEISKLNGDFKRNYGQLIGAFLYLRSISAARGRSWVWAGLVSFACSLALAWLERHGRIPSIWF